MKTTDTYSFIYNCNLKYGKDYFDFSETKYIGSRQKLKVKCKFCGKDIIGFPSQFLNDNRDCECHRLLTNEKIIEQAHKIHDPIRKEKNLPPYTYEKLNYVDKNTKVLITCPLHKEFPMLVSNHLSHKQGCPKCNNIEKSIKQTYSKEEFVEKSIQAHKEKLQKHNIPEYDYSEKNYIDSRHDITFRCLLHGYKTQNAGSHMFGTLCKECSKIIVAEEQKLTLDEIYERSKELYPTRNYTYEKVRFNKITDEVIITCPLHGDFDSTLQAHLFYGKECPVCKPHNLSGAEQEICNFLTQNNFKLSTNNRHIIKPKELDIYITEKKIAIEFDGTYWHSELYKSNDYHLQKTIDCEKQGIQLIHIFEDEWLEKRSIVESRLLNLLGCTKYNIGARKCKIKQVPIEQERSFLQTNHLQGYVASTICYGLYYYNKPNNKEYLVALMSFGPLRISTGNKPQEGQYELYRFVTAKNFSITGGASRLFKHFIKIFNPKKIISFADRRWSIHSENNLYSKLGFKLKSISKPNYFYVEKSIAKRHSRFKFTKHKLKELGCPDNMTEHEFMNSIGYFQLYDCGQLVYEYSI